MMDQEPTADQAQENAREPSPEAIAYAKQVFGDAYKSEYSGHIALVEDAFDAGRAFEDDEDHNPDQFVHASPEVVRVIGDAVARHVGAWDGPFTVERREDSNVGNHYAVVSQSGDFAMVFDEDCIGAELGTKARATRIAEALNRTRKTLPQSCTLVALRDAGLWAEANAAVTGLHEDDRARLGLLAEFVRVNLPNMGGPHD